MPRLGVLISGGGRTLANLLDHAADGRLRAFVDLVIADRDCPGLALARARGVRAELIPGEMPPDVADEVVTRAGLDAIVLAGYLRRVPITARNRGRIVNIHPSLLPAFGGRGMHGRRVHEAVLDAARRPDGPTRSGCTIHLCDDTYDTGPILCQATCPILPDDTPDTLAARVFALECRYYPVVIASWLAGECVAPSPATVEAPLP